MLKADKKFQAFKHFGGNHPVLTPKGIPVLNFDDGTHKKYIFKILK